MANVPTHVHQACALAQTQHIWMFHVMVKVLSCHILALFIISTEAGNLLRRGSAKRADLMNHERILKKTQNASAKGIGQPELVEYVPA